MKASLMWIALLTLAVASGCDTGPKSSRGFRLPEGNAEKGKQVFLDLKCNTCHRVEGVELAPPTAFNLTLGGETARVKTYGELVTSIINPSHIISQNHLAELKEAKLSPMPDYNRMMTVEQMIDLVAFVQPHYRVAVPDMTPTYHP